MRSKFPSSLKLWGLQWDRAGFLKPVVPQPKSFEDSISVPHYPPSIRWRIHCRDSNRDSLHTSPSSVKMESAFRGSKCLISKLFKWFSTVSWTCIGSTPAQRDQNTWQMQCSPREHSSSISRFPLRTETTPKFIHTEKMTGEPSVLLPSHTDTDLQIFHLISSMLNCLGSQAGHNLSLVLLIRHIKSNTSHLQDCYWCGTKMQGYCTPERD